MGSVKIKTLAAILLFAPGCFWVTTKAEGNQIKTNVASLQATVTKQQSSIDTRVKQLDDELEKATALLKRNSADVGAEVEALGKDMATVNGGIDQVKQTLDDLKTQLAEQKSANDRLRADLSAAEARIDTLEKAMAKPVVTEKPVDKDTLFDGAYGKLQQGNYDDARHDFRDFVKKFPNDEKADNAQYWIGETFFKQKEYEKAIAEFQKVIDTYPNGDMADDAFLEAGNAAVQLKWCVDANAYFAELINRFPKSALAKQAKTQMDFIKKNQKKKDVCQAG
jgi:tol-pal system protein YbgF